MRVIFNDLRRSIVFISFVVLISFFIYIISYLYNYYDYLKDGSNNIDIVLPIIIIGVVLKNFKYLKLKKECEMLYAVSLPKSKIFKCRYVVSLLQISIIYICLTIISFAIFLYASQTREEITEGINVLDLGMYTLSVLTKLGFSYLLFNFVLFFFLLGNKLLDSLNYLIIASFALTLILLVIMSMFNINIMYYKTSFIFPFNIFSIITGIYKAGIHNLPIDGPMNSLLYPLIFIGVLCLILSPFTFKRGRSITRESLNIQGNTIILLSQIIVISLLTSLVVGFMCISIIISYICIIVIHILCYLIYSSFINRFKFTKMEWGVFLSLLCFGLLFALCI